MTPNTTENPSSEHGGLSAAHECALIENDLERLKSLINDAGDRLVISFNKVTAVLAELSVDHGQRDRMDHAVRGAVTALQFQDMATQLIGHAQRRLSVLEASAVASVGLASREKDMALSHPVRQVELSAGSVDLF
jgi:hypothetical protein